MALYEEMTVREAARVTRRSAETIRRWIWSGRLPARKHGNMYYVDAFDLRRLAVIIDPDADLHGGEMAGWLAELDEWKSGLPAPTQDSAASLVTEDRRARR